MFSTFTFFSPGWPNHFQNHNRRSQNKMKERGKKPDFFCIKYFFLLLAFYCNCTRKWLQTTQQALQLVPLLQIQWLQKLKVALKNILSLKILDLTQTKSTRRANLFDGNVVRSQLINSMDSWPGHYFLDLWGCEGLCWITFSNSRYYAPRVIS